MEALKALKHYFGYDSFRPGQEDIINTILSGQDTLAILPTGAGKSICYQLPALMFDGLTIVISPLISLMKDQVDSLRQANIRASYINSTLNDFEYWQVMEAIEQNLVNILYLAPERLEVSSFVDFITKQPVRMIAVDEAHCVSQWGHDFRPSYRGIKNFINEFNNRPIITAFTATATKRVQDDIINQLTLNNVKVFVNSFDRPNIKFRVETPSNKNQALLSHLNHEDSMIIYAQTRKNVDNIYESLRKRGYKIRRYHAGMPDDERQLSQDAFIKDEANIIVATNAFGMGIDKTDVRKVIHYNLPTCLENYYQEAGRAGRDSLPSEAVLLFSRSDIMGAKFLIENSQEPLVKERLEVMVRYANLSSCLRAYILNYFGDYSITTCNNCSSCLNEFSLHEVTKEAQIILSCIVRLKHNYGMTMVTDVLRGSRKQTILDRGHNKLSTYGLLRNYSQNDVMDMISALVAQGYLYITEHRGLALTQKALKILKGEEKFYIKKSQRRKITEPISLTSQESDNTELYEELRKLRQEIAKEAKLPAYIIFNNRSLVDMANRMPTTYEEFLEVEGVGKIKANHYFEAFTTVIKNYINRKQGETS